jgi:transposase-like protein
MRAVDGSGEVAVPAYAVQSDRDPRADGDGADARWPVDTPLPGWARTGWREGRASFGEHLCVVALGIGVDGTKHPLGLAEGSTENTTVVTELLTGLRDRGLDTTRPILVGIDGAKALRAAVTAVFDHPVIQRCQLHKLRNVADKLPDHLAATVAKRMRAAYYADSALAAEA